MKQIGERLKKVRLNLKLTQEELGIALGEENKPLKKQHISAIENGRTNLNIIQMAKLVKKYNVSLNYLVAGIEPCFIQISEPIEYKIKKEIEQILKERGL